MRIYFHGHACFEIVGEAGRILIDPFLTGNPNTTAKPEDFDQLDAILVTHGHKYHIGMRLSYLSRLEPRLLQCLS